MCRRRLIDRSQQLCRTLNIIDDQTFVNRDRIVARARIFFDVDIVQVGRVDGLREYRRIGGQTTDTIFVDECRQCTVREKIAAKIVEPNALSEFVQRTQRARHETSSASSSDAMLSGQRQLRISGRSSPCVLMY